MVFKIKGCGAVQMINQIKYALVSLGVITKIVFVIRYPVLITEFRGEFGREV